MNYYDKRARRLSLHIEVHTRLKVPDQQQFMRWIFETMQRDYQYAYIGLLLCDKQEACQYNLRYRHQDHATNVLSFPLENCQGRILTGDLIMCVSIVHKEAQEQKKTTHAHYAHLTVHGILHLMGKDHLIEEQAIAMEQEEVTVLARMGYTNPYLLEESELSNGRRIVETQDMASIMVGID